MHVTLCISRKESWHMMDPFHLSDICLLSTYYVLGAWSLPLAEEVRLLFIKKYLKAYYVLDTLHKGF